MYKRSYEALAEQQAAVARPYIALAKLIDCDPDEIAIVTSSTTAWFQVGAVSISIQAGAAPNNV